MDLAAFTREMAVTIERVKQDDPRALRAALAEARQTIAKLTRELETKALYVSVDRPVLSDDDRRLLTAIVTKLGAVGAAPPIVRPPVATDATIRARLSARAAERNGGSLARGERQILSVLAQYPERTKTQVAILAGYAVTGGGFNNYLGALRSRGYVVGKDTLQITGAGVEALGPIDPLPTGRALAAHWQGQLSRAERAIFDQLVEVYPAGLTKAALGERTGYDAAGGGFNNALGRLRTLELITRGPEIRASATLFSPD